MDVAIRDATVAAAVGNDGVLGALGQIGAASIELELAKDLTLPNITRSGETLTISDQAAADSVKSWLLEHGVRVCALLIGNDFTTEDCDADVKWAINASRTAAAMGVPAVRIDPLSRDKEISPAQALERFTRAVKRAARELPEGVELAIENHGPIANDPTWLQEMVKTLDNPRIGLTLDTGNFYWYGFALDEVHELISTYAKRARHAHIKNINYPPEAANIQREIGWEYRPYCCALDEGNLDLRRIVRSFRGAGYDRDLCIENESLFKHPPEKRLDVLKRDVHALRAAMSPNII